MSAPLKKDKFTPELRILAASLLSMVVILVWAKYFGPKPPANPPQQNRPAQTAPVTPGAATSPAPANAQAPSAPTAMALAPAAAVKPQSASEERSSHVQGHDRSRPY